jgi:uncharacterized membrane protein YsdA (DUF1294 family)
MEFHRLTTKKASPRRRAVIYLKAPLYFFLRMKPVIVKILILYLSFINLTGFVSMGRDKRKAAEHRRRTPERRLMTYAVLGGSIGCLLGMAVWRHKTRHLKFTLGLPLILAVQIIAAATAVLLF